MKFLFGVNHGNTSNRLVKLLQLEVHAGGAKQAEEKSSKAGKRRWLIDDSVGSFILSMKLPFPSDPKKFLVDRLQGFIVSPGSPPLVVGNARVTTLGPRLAASTIAVTGAGPASFMFDLDVNFIDVTAMGSAQTTPATFSPTNGCRFVLLEYTGAGGPPCWAVFLPTALPAATGAARNVSTFLFLRPVAKASYTSTDDVAPAMTAQMSRYVSDQPVVPPSEMWRPSSGTDPPEFPGYKNCGFERQVAAAAKAVAFVFPIPSKGVGHGDAASATAAALLESVLAALWDSGKLGLDGHPIRPGKRALGGYSHGGKLTLQTLAHAGNQKAFDEVYLFDPAGFGGAGLRANVSTWFALGGKTLRMIGGGYQHKAMMDFLPKLSGGTVTVWPPKMDFWYTAAEYARGVSRAAAKGAVESLTAVGGTPPADSASQVSGIFLDTFTLDPTDPIHKSKLVVVTAGKAQTHTYQGFRHTVAGEEHGHIVPSPTEVAAVLRWNVIERYAGNKPVTATNFAAVTDRVTENEEAGERDRLGSARHEWTVYGGADLGGGYKGFLQHCLENSKL